jgi:hypothetical protein
MNENDEKTGSTTNPTDIISAILSNPETISKLSGILSKFTSSENSTDPPPEDIFSSNNTINNAINNDSSATINVISPTEAPPNELNSGIDFSKIAPVLSMLKPPSNAKNNPQIALLLAIKPYLSSRRKELIDSFIQITNFSEIFKNFSQKEGSDVL